MVPPHRQLRTGFIGIVGPTNAGKSTLLNGLIGQKISIVSPKVQTTYHGIRGILTTSTAQFVFVDTPGLQHHREKVAKLLNRVADRSASEADWLIWVFDSSHSGIVTQCRWLENRIRSRGKEKNICVLNKVDKIKKETLLPIIQKLASLELFSEIIPISAKQKEGLDRIIQFFERQLPAGTPFYPDDMMTDRSQQFLVSEIVREKIYLSTKQEIPYSVWVEIERWENEGAIPKIHAIIHVDAPSRKGILIGREGEMLKRIGIQARTEIETLLGGQICLKLHVSVDQDWRLDSRLLNRYLELV